MYTIEIASFKRVGKVAFSTDGRLAALDARDWNCEVSPLPPDPAKVWLDWDVEPYAYGLGFDPRTGYVIHGDEIDGLIATDPTTPYEPARFQEDAPLRLGWDILRCDIKGWNAFDGSMRSFAISPNGDRLVCGCELRRGPTKNKTQSRAAQLVSFTRAGKQTHWKEGTTFEGDGFEFRDVAFFPNGKRFASIEWSRRKQRKGGRSYSAGDVPTLRVHDAKSLTELDSTTFKQPADDLVVCGNSVVVRGEKSFRVWDAADLTAKPSVVAGKKLLTAIAADPQGRFVLTATGDSVSVWDSTSWAATKTYEWTAGKITCLAVSPDGLLAAAGTATGKVVVWDTE